jgi:hypothetical protein
LPGFFDEKSKGRGEEENVLDSWVQSSLKRFSH